MALRAIKGDEPPAFSVGRASRPAKPSAARLLIYSLHRIDSRFAASARRGQAQEAQCRLVFREREFCTSLSHGALCPRTFCRQTANNIGPPINADERRWKTKALSAFIRVDRRPFESGNLLQRVCSQRGKFRRVMLCLHWICVDCSLAGKLSDIGPEARDTVSHAACVMFSHVHRFFNRAFSGDGFNSKRAVRRPTLQ